MGTKISEIEYSCNGKMLRFARPKVMAIINLTPDSFYDGGKYERIADVERDIAQKISEGADILDLGAASSRPGAAEIPVEEEWQRLSAILTHTRKTFPKSIISIDTYRAEIARRSAMEGADMINDISAGNLDDQMVNVMAENGLPYVLMHMPGDPRTMKNTKPYENAAGTVFGELLATAGKFEAAGVKQLILDPGFGFGKSLENNYTLLKSLGDLTGAGYPVMAGLSRKSMIWKVLGASPVTAMNGTTALNTIALLNGASILRVHDVAEAQQVISLVKQYKEVA